MTVQREARHLSGADIGRTVTCYDQYTGDSITAELFGVIQAQSFVYLMFGPDRTYLLRPDQVVTVTGAPSPPYWDEGRDGPNDARLAGQGVNIEPTDNINHDSYKGMP